ncbi:hypothetical protein HNP00_002423 [Arthrobacter sp. AZCC_0090]|nr:hypothetical protein [Arthrobacter sp. AZCC_0090]
MAISVQIGPGQPQATLGSAGIARPSSTITWILGATMGGIGPERR